MKTANIFSEYILSRYKCTFENNIEVICWYYNILKATDMNRTGIFDIIYYTMTKLILYSAHIEKLWLL